MSFQEIKKPDEKGTAKTKEKRSCLPIVICVVVTLVLLALVMIFGTGRPGSRPASSPDTEMAATTACHNRVREQGSGNAVTFRDSLPAIHDEHGWVIQGTVTVNNRLYDYGCELHLSSGKWFIDDFMLDPH